MRNIAFQKLHLLSRGGACALGLALAATFSYAQDQTKHVLDYRDTIIPSDLPADLQMPDPMTATLTTALRVQNGKYLPGESVTKAVTGGPITADGATGLKIASQAGGLNGLLVKGVQSTFTLSNSTIDLRGDGGNELLGQGAAALVLNGTLVLKNVKIETSGKLRSAVLTTHHGELKVIDSEIIANGGRVTASEDFTTALPGGMGTGAPENGVPGGVHLKGTSRAALTLDNSSSYYIHSKIQAEGWGAISTDGANGYVYVEADDCDITLLHDGYGFYSDLGSHVVLKNSRVKSGQYIGIIAGPAQGVLENVTAEAGGEGFMVHSIMGSPLDVSLLSIKGGSIQSKRSLFWVLSSNAEINVDGAKMQAANGKLIEMLKDSDKNTTKLRGWKVQGVKATLKNMTLEGSLSNEDSERDLAVSLVSTALKGAVSNAFLSLDAASKWTATADSTVTLTGAASVKNIDAPAGVTIKATAGEGCTLKGDYTLPSGGALHIGGGKG